LNDAEHPALPAASKIDDTQEVTVSGGQLGSEIIWPWGHIPRGTFLVCSASLAGSIVVEHLGWAGGRLNPAAHARADQRMNNE